MSVTVPAGARRSSATLAGGGGGGFSHIANNATATTAGFDLAAMAKTIRDLEAQLAAGAAAAASTSGGGAQQDGGAHYGGPLRSPRFNTQANPLTTTTMLLAGDPGPGPANIGSGGGGGGSRRNSLGVQQQSLAATAPAATGGAGSRRNSGAGGGAAPAALPRADTAVLTQIAIAMQNDPALAGQLRAIVSAEGGGGGGGNVAV
jgi:hypothetical protein